MDGNSIQSESSAADEIAGPAGELLSLDDLLRITRRKSAEGRRQRTDAMRAVCWGARVEPVIQDIAVMAEIIRSLVHETEMSIRVRLAARLSERADTPETLLVELGNEAFKIAHPVLARSESLLDDELMEAVQFRTTEYQLSNRPPNVQPPDAKSGTENHATHGMEAASAEDGASPPPDDTRDRLTAPSQRGDAPRKPRIRRQDLGPALTRRLHWWVAAAIRSHVLVTYEVSPATLDNAVEDAVRAVLSSHSAPSTNAISGDRPSGRPNAPSSTDPRLLVRLLRDGEIMLFISQFAKMTGLRYRLVRRFLFEADGIGLAIACKAVNIAKTDFASICRIGLQAAAGGAPVDREVAAAVGLFNRISPDAAVAMLCLWRRDQEYLNALRLLDEPGATIY